MTKASDETPPPSVPPLVPMQGGAYIRAADGSLTLEAAPRSAVQTTLEAPVEAAVQPAKKGGRDAT